MSEEQVVTVDLSNVQFPDVMDLRTAAMFLDISEMRVRTLAKEGEIGYKNEAGHWRFDLDSLTEYKETMGSRRGGYRRGDRKYWKIQVKHDDLEEVGELLEPFGIEIEPAYNYEKKSDEDEEDEDEGGLF